MGTKESNPVEPTVKESPNYYYNYNITPSFDPTIKVDQFFGKFDDYLSEFTEFFTKPPYYGKNRMVIQFTYEELPIQRRVIGVWLEKIHSQIGISRLSSCIDINKRWLDDYNILKELYENVPLLLEPAEIEHVILYHGKEVLYKLVTEVGIFHTDQIKFICSHLVFLNLPEKIQTEILVLFRECLSTWGENWIEISFVSTTIPHNLQSLLQLSCDKLLMKTSNWFPHLFVDVPHYCKKNDCFFDICVWSSHMNDLYSSIVKMDHFEDYLTTKEPRNELSELAHKTIEILSHLELLDVSRFAHVKFECKVTEYRLYTWMFNGHSKFHSLPFFFEEKILQVLKGKFNLAKWKQPVKKIQDMRFHFK